MEFNTLCLILSIAAVVLCAVFFAAGILYRKKVAEKQITPLSGAVTSRKCEATSSASAVTRKSRRPCAK